MLLFALLLTAAEPLVEPGLTDFMPVSASAADFDEVQLQSFIRDAGASKTHALLVLRDGKVVVERYWDHKPDMLIKTRSITKTISALAIALLIDDGKIASVDEPISRWIPEWKSDARKAITLRHVLSHTSGLEPRFGDAELTVEGDAIAFVRKMKLVDPPGTTYVYSNQAFELISYIVQQEAKEPLANFAKKRLFAPLGIVDTQWSADKTGLNHGYAGLELRARDVARLGQMLCDDGRVSGKQLISQKWLAQATKPAQPFQQIYGLGLELFPELGYERGNVVYNEAVEAKLKSAGFNVAKLSALRGRTFDDVDALAIQAAGLLDQSERTQFSELIARRVLEEVRPTSDVQAFGHSGSFGQLMMCVRQPNMKPTVVVRMLREPGLPFPAIERARLTLHPARVCPAFYESDGAGECIARGKGRVILFLHGMYNPHGSQWSVASEKRFVERALARGYTVYAPRGQQGLSSEWLAFPTGRGQLNELVKVAQTMNATLQKLGKPVLLFGYSAGGYASSALVSQTKLTFVAWVNAHGGGTGYDFSASAAIPTLLITARGDAGERPNAYAFSAKLERAGWKHKLIDEPGTHALTDADIVAALDFFDAQ
jgi:CubicO group peptidase (beta-lactamase class C family)